MTDQENLMRRLQMQSFALVDTGLFLDTHPNDQKAMDYHRRYTSMYQETLKEYTAKYGPISQGDVTGDSWNWVETPWPWEGSAY